MYGLSGMSIEWPNSFERTLSGVSGSGVVLVDHEWSAGLSGPWWF